MNYLPLDTSLIGNLYVNLWNTMALEWYLHAMSLEEVDLKFVSASTELECILGKFFLLIGNLNMKQQISYQKILNVLKIKLNP